MVEIYGKGGIKGVFGLKYLKVEFSIVKELIQVSEWIFLGVFFSFC